MIKVTKLTGKELINSIVNHCWGVNSSASLEKWYKSEHSPIYSQIFVIYADMPKSVMEQLRTHEKNGMQFYSSSGRPDTGNEQDNSRTAIRKVVILCNAKHLMDMAKKRLCNKAEKPTREFMKQLKQEIALIDPALANSMIPSCEYRAEGCTEFKPCNKKVTK